MADPNCPECHGCGQVVRIFTVTDSDGKQHSQQIAVPCRSC